MGRPVSGTFLLDAVPSRALDLTGNISGRLTIKGIHSKVVFSGGGQVFMWKAVCQCGNKPVVNGQHFVNGGIKSCGCLRQDRSSLRCSRKPMRKPGALVNMLPALKVSDKDLADLGRTWANLSGRKMGKLLVKKFLYGKMYWVRGKSKKKKSVIVKIVTYYDCVCECGNKVVRHSNYLRRLAVTPACNTCRWTGRKKSVPVAP